VTVTIQYRLGTIQRASPDEPDILAVCPR